MIHHSEAPLIEMHSSMGLHVHQVIGRQVFGNSPRQGGMGRGGGGGIPSRGLQAQGLQQS